MPNRHTTLISLFDDIADAIRNKTGDSAEIKADDFDTAIAAIPSGGGGSDDYFYIEGIEAGTINFDNTGPVDVALQYSTDKTNWTNYTLGTDINIAANQKIYWKNNKGYLSTDSTNYVKISSSKTFNVGGRINSLINDIDGKGCYPYAFYRLFYASKVVDASNLVLNLHLGNNCYDSMFRSCTSLTTAPQLPATVLAGSCYYYMFQNCSSLTTAPQLPATVLQSSCYNYMFSACTSLTTVPNLPATVLQSSCYTAMFVNCTSLKVYSTSGEGHDKAWTIPSTGPIIGTTRSMNDMFAGVETDNVPGAWPGTTGEQFIYYTQNNPV